MKLGLSIKLPKWGLFRKPAGVVLLSFVLSSIMISACGTPQSIAVTPFVLTLPATQVSAPALAPSPTPAPTLPTNAPNIPTSTPAPTLTSVATSQATPTATATTLATAQEIRPTQTLPSLWIYLAADIQNNVNGVDQVLNVSADNGTVDILIRTTYLDQQFQPNTSFNVVKYLSTYFTPLDNRGIANLFGGTQFSIHIKTQSIGEEYFLESTTSYSLMMLVGQNQVDQNQWYEQANAVATMNYYVGVTCDVTPNTVSANTDTPITIDGWLLYHSKYLPIRYLTASWQDSTGHQYYCAGERYDSSCKGESGLVKAGDVITVNVAILSDNDMNFTCQATYTTP